MSFCNAAAEVLVEEQKWETVKWDYITGQKGELGGGFSFFLFTSPLFGQENAYPSSWEKVLKVSLFVVEPQC